MAILIKPPHTKFAKEFYGKNDGDSVDRRISVISNVLIAAKLCESKPLVLRLIEQ